MTLTTRNSPSGVRRSPRRRSLDVPPRPMEMPGKLAITRSPRITDRIEAPVSTRTHVSSPDAGGETANSGNSSDRTPSNPPAARLRPRTWEGNAGFF